MEVWKDIGGFEGKYQVSSEGRIKSVDRILVKSDGKIMTIKGRILKQSSSRGYLRVSLGGDVTVDVHRIVAITFLGKPNENNVVNHLNEDKHDNRVSNLEWTTPLGNTRHGTGIARRVASRNYKEDMKVLRKPVKGISFDGKLIIHLDAAKESLVLGFDPSRVGKCCRNESKYHKGFYWKFK